MKKKSSLLQECSVAVTLLRSWGVLQEGENYPPSNLLPVVTVYSGEGWCYRFGGNLFEHLAKSATIKNQWVPHGPGDPKGTLAQFLFKTTFRATRTTRKEVVALFKEIADRVKNDYGEKVNFDHTVSAEENVKRAETIEIRHWTDRFLKNESKGA